MAAVFCGSCICILLERAKIWACTYAEPSLHLTSQLHSDPVLLHKARPAGEQVSKALRTCALIVAAALALCVMHKLGPAIKQSPVHFVTSLSRQHCTP
eukprot:399794-Pelagomonas_calceolata.AAC.1